MAKDKAPALSLRASHEVLQLIAEIDEFITSNATVVLDDLEAIKGTRTIEHF